MARCCRFIPSESLKIEPSLDPSRRYCRPWTLDFVNDLSQAYYNRFHAQIQLNSAVRTVKVQKKLRRHNRNAAPAEGDTASSHLAGVTVDLQRRGMTKDQIVWMEHYLFYMKALGLVEPEEERRHWCFHIMVSGLYSDWRETQNIVPIEHPDNAHADSRRPISGRSRQRQQVVRRFRFQFPVPSHFLRKSVTILFS